MGEWTAMDSMDVTLALAEQVLLPANQVSEPWTQVSSLGLMPFSIWNDSGCLSHLVSHGFLLCFGESLIVMAFLCI